MKKNKYIKVGLIILIFLLLSISMKLFEDTTEITLKHVKFTIFTFIIWGCQYLIFKGLTNKTVLSISLVIGIETTFDIINFIIRNIRGSAITISDIFAIRTAMSVSKNINIEFDQKFIIGIIVTLLICFLLVLLKNYYSKLYTDDNTTNLQQPKNNSNKKRAFQIVSGLMVLLISTQLNLFKTQSLWDINECYAKIGTPITILRMMYNFNVKAPKGYNKKEASKILNKYKPIASQEINQEDTPNIIVIINESFCDYYNLYKQGYKDPIKYFTELSKSKNVVSGVMYSSEFGGQTSNVEYEFLTQNSTRILPTGSFVFQQYIPKQIKSSLVEHLKSKGYKTSAIHPWEDYAYSRNKVYRLLGFDSIKFKNDIDGLEKTFNNDFFTDRSTYKELMKQIKEKDKNEKLFEYVLTVQNHTGYLKEDPNQEKYSNVEAENVYMQLIHESSEALKEVVNELEQIDEKYILLFFGDHQPNPDGKDYPNRPIKQYEVPFLIWANYDIEEQYDVKTSTIFLQNYLLKTADVELSLMNQYMEELQKTYPIITKRFYADINGKIFKDKDDESRDFYKIEEYNKIDYYRIFDINVEK